MQKTNYFFFRLLIGLLIISSVNTFGQSSKIIDAYEDYTEAPREIAYAHLNKSTYIEGEILGFTAYVFDKFTKEPSKLTSNLYCTISNQKGEILKKKLIKIGKGIASNVFDVDSTLSTGIFTFKAYTNWMKNFDEQNYFEQTFKVIDADNIGEVKPVSKEDIKVDLQVLGEGGHLLYDVSNSIGIITKNQFGYGISNAFGNITDNNGEIVSEFKLNDSGLAKTIFTPIKGFQYTVNINLSNNKISQPIKNIATFGMVMSLTDLEDKVSILIKTNNQTIDRIKNKKFQIAAHNGSNVVVTPFKINENGQIILKYIKKELFSGINIFTVFNEDSKPILERLYLNTNNISQGKISKVNLKATNDSIDISLKFKDIDPKFLSNLSVSVLPSQTKSYNHHNNLLSQLYIQPYVKGSIQNAGRYFENTKKETLYDADLLMLTQGWSSYDWNSIFSKNEREFIYPFEKGISVVASINDDKYGSYVVYPLSNSATQLFNVSSKQNEFTVKETFPNDEDLFRIGYIDAQKKQFKEKPSLYLQFYPSKFSNFNASDGNLIKQAYTLNETSIKPNQQNNAFDISKINALDEVVINASLNKRHTEIEKLKEKAIIARYRIVEENIKKRGMRVDIYLQRLGFATDYDIFSGSLTISNGRAVGKDSTPLVYLDNTLLTTSGKDSDFGILTFLTMEVIDYIEYELYGFGGGIRGSAGYIKIFTTPGGPIRKKPNNVATYEVPLRFSKEKKFYTPKYQYYNTDFFNEYGTIGWLPNIKVDESGLANLKIYDTKTQNITLFVEGVINENQYISQHIKIERNN